MKSSTLMGLLSLLFIAGALPAQLDPAVQARIDSIFAKFDRKDSPGCALGVVRGGELLYARGYGQATLEYDVPVTPSTVFHVASVSKQFTAFAVAMLAEQGKLSLDDDIRKHLPELPGFGHPITVRQLIHHTSGLRDQWNLLALAGWRLDDVITRDQIMRLVTRQEALNFEPGAEHLYCNTGYTLMAEIVSRVSGKPFPEWMAENVFTPLGMTHTLMYDDHERIVPNRAYSYYPTAGGFKKSVLSYANAGATSLFTTVEDLARWAANFREPKEGSPGSVLIATDRVEISREPKVGSPALIRQMHERGILNNGDTLSYAFGLVVDTYKGLPRVQHGGADAGYRTYLARFPEQDYAIIVLSNLANANPGGLAMQVADIVLADHINAPEQAAASDAPAAIRMSPGRLARYTGTFFLESVGVKFEASVRGDSLFFKQLWDQQEYAVLPSSDTTFFVAADPGAVQFVFRDFSRGTAARFVVRQGGTEYLGRRIDGDQPAPDLAPYAGRYYSRELDTAYDLAPDGDKLRARHQRHPSFELTLTTPDKAVSDQWFFGSATFTRDAQGAVSGMKVSSGRVRDVWFERVRD